MTMSTCSADALHYVRNRFALLLAAARPQLGALEFGRMLRLQERGDVWLLRGGRSPRPAVTPRHVLDQVERMASALESGEMPRLEMERLCRDYELLFGGGDGGV